MYVLWEHDSGNGEGIGGRKHDDGGKYGNLCYHDSGKEALLGYKDGTFRHLNH